MEFVGIFIVLVLVIVVGSAIAELPSGSAPVYRDVHGYYTGTYLGRDRVYY